MKVGNEARPAGRLPMISEETSSANIRRLAIGAFVVVTCMSCSSAETDLASQTTAAVEAFAANDAETLYAMQTEECMSTLTLEEFGEQLSSQRSKMETIMSISPENIQTGNIDFDPDVDPTQVRLELVDASDGSVVFDQRSNRSLWTQQNSTWVFRTCGDMPVPQR